MLRGTVKYAEPLGAETLVHLVLPGGEPLTVRQDGQSGIPASGENCPVSFAGNDVCLFDDAGKRIGAV